MQLTDQVAIITGSARGIGRATALCLAREGARIVVADIDAAGAQEAAAWDSTLKIHLFGTFFIEGLWIYHSQFPSSGCLQMSGDRYRGVKGDLRRVLDHHDFHPFGASF
jgi:NAD(P)-dependent dehydrogenase (short-subunit alcohol dehydrogenase family)